MSLGQYNDLSTEELWEALKFQDEFIIDQNEKLKLFHKECEAYKEVLIYCKHNKTGQGAKINGVLWLYGDD
tara:strand:- start:5659 stop:5871 length:213 start_codon:yes stop_codon:yes gene_type:complete